MKKWFLILFFLFWSAFLSVFAAPTKILSLNYDNYSSLININKLSDYSTLNKNLKYSTLENPKRIYFDIDESILIGEKQHLVFEKSPIKEIKIAQFSTEPNVVRIVITLEEDFDTSKIKITENSNNIFVNLSSPDIANKYFVTIFDKNGANDKYSSIVANSLITQKIDIPQSANQASKDIEQALSNSTLANTDGKTYDSTISLDLSSNLKLRTKYYLGSYFIKKEGLLLNGYGQIGLSNIFTLDSPKRLVVDLSNTFVDKKLRNKEFSLCIDGSCKDTAKIGQFEFNKARIVITTETPDKYIPIISSDLQSLLLVNANKFNHSYLSQNITNLSNTNVQKINDKTSELTLSFTKPVITSFLTKDNKLTFYLFNVKSYNELSLIKNTENTAFKDFTVSLLPQIGIKAELKIDKNDIYKIEQSIDGKNLKLCLTTDNNRQIEKTQIITPKKDKIKNKVVLDAGHGGTDYGAIREGINEKDITLDITQRVANILKTKGYKVALTRNDDTYLSLQDRVDFSENETPEVFVSIHVNAAISKDPKGIETHYYHEYSKDFAQIVHNHLIKNVDTKDRGLLKSKFYVINHTTVPAILIETGFLSNDEERAELLTEKRKYRTAKAIAEGIIEYIKSQK